MLSKEKINKISFELIKEIDLNELTYSEFYEVLIIVKKNFDHRIYNLTRELELIENHSDYLIKKSLEEIKNMRMEIDNAK